MSEPEIGTYLDADGARHRLVVRRTADGDWHVLDIDVTSDTAHVVDTLAGEQDGRPQAEAIARDYLTTVGRLASPGRDRRPASPYLSREDPMPAATAAPARHRANTAREGLRCRVRLADGRVFTGCARRRAPPRPAARHPARAVRRAGRDRRGRPPRRAAADHDPPARRSLPARRQARWRRVA